MAKSFPIRLLVEEVALGTVLRKLNDMPGIVKLDLDLGHGGQGEGRQELEQQARSNGDTAEQAVLKLLMQGPKHIQDLQRSLGGAKSRAYGAVHQLKKKGFTEAGAGKGMHQLTKKAMAQLGLVKALPAPTPSAKLKKSPTGRAAQGSGPIMLKSILAEGPKAPVEIKKLAAEQGMSPKSISGVMDRARRDGLIKKNGASGGYELTAKGQKIETAPEAANG